MRSSSSLDEYGFKIRKVSGPRAAVSNETILLTRKEFLLTKVAPYKAKLTLYFLIFG